MNHVRSAFNCIWEGTVSRWALHASRGNVLCVPAPALQADVRLPHMRNVLAATDFSPAGNEAIALACAVAEPGATVHLVHVVPARPAPALAARDIFALEHTAKSDAQREQIHAALAALVPSDVRDRSLRYYLLESNEPATAIVQAAARLEADAICVGRRGRSAVAHKILGSVSEHVLSHADRPVCLAHAPRE